MCCIGTLQRAHPLRHMTIVVLTFVAYNTAKPWASKQPRNQKTHLGLAQFTVVHAHGSRTSPDAFGCRCLGRHWMSLCVAKYALEPQQEEPKHKVSLPQVQPQPPRNLNTSISWHLYAMPHTSILVPGRPSHDSPELPPRRKPLVYNPQWDEEKSVGSRGPVAPPC